MAARALDFATAHPAADPGFATVLKRLGDIVARADAMAMQEQDGHTAERAAIARRHEVRNSVRRSQLRRLVRLAELAAKTNPEMKGKFFLPPGDIPNKPFLTAARSLLAAALPYRDLLVSLGLGETYIEDLTKATEDSTAPRRPRMAGAQPTWPRGRTFLC